MTELNKKFLINQKSNLQDALNKLNKLKKGSVLFTIDKNGKLCGSITDGDIRRAVLKGANTKTPISTIENINPKFVLKDEEYFKKLIEYREKGFGLIPVINSHKTIIDIINFNEINSNLPIDTVIMAGGRGQRLMPLTEQTPKPLIKIEGKAVIEYNIERLRSYGVKDFWISINYKGDLIKKFFKERYLNDFNYQFVSENKQLGTIGAVSKIKEFNNKFVLIANSDIITKVDYELFFLDFLEKEADISVLTVPYQIDIPYAIIESKNNLVKKIREKPTYTYFSNGGIYLLKKEVLTNIPYNTFYNATDLIELAIEKKMKVLSFPFNDYWIDIGRMEDLKKTKHDLKHINLFGK